MKAFKAFQGTTSENKNLSLFFLFVRDWDGKGQKICKDPTIE